MGTRTVIQVKSYAKHYFKQKVRLSFWLQGISPYVLHSEGLRLLFTFFAQRKSEPGAAAPSTGPVLHPQSIPSEASTLANAVRIEKLSDDEDVDITDDLSEDEATDVKTQAEPKTELLGSEEQVKGEIQTEKSSQEPEKTAQNESESIWNAVQSHRKSFCPQSRDASSSGVCAEENRETRLHHNISKTGQIFPGSFQTQTGFKQVTGDLQDQSCQCDLIAQTGDVENHSFERMGTFPISVFLCQQWLWSLTSFM